MPRSTKVLDMHTRPLAPLLLGDKVFLHKPATVVELGNYDQYVKVDGSWCLSLRNRRFLRKCVPPSVTIGDPLSHSRQSYGLATRTVLPPTSSKSPQLTTSHPQLEQHQKYGSSTPIKRPSTPSVQPTDAVFVPVPDWIVRDRQTQYLRCLPPHQQLLHWLIYLHQCSPKTTALPCRHYVPETGKWQEHWRSRCYNTRLYTIFIIVISLERGGGA